MSDGELQNTIPSEAQHDQRHAFSTQKVVTPAVTDFEGFCQQTGLSASKGRRLINAGEIPIIKIGTAIRIRQREIEIFLDRHTLVRGETA